MESMESIIGKLVLDITSAEANYTPLRTPELCNFTIKEWSILYSEFSKILSNYGDEFTNSLFEVDPVKNAETILRAISTFLVMAGSAQYAAQRIITRIENSGHEVVITYDSKRKMLMTTKEIPTTTSDANVTTEIKLNDGQTVQILDNNTLVTIPPAAYCKVCGKQLDDTAIKETQLCTPCFTSNA